MPQGLVYFRKTKFRTYIRLAIEGSRRCERSAAHNHSVEKWDIFALWQGPVFPVSPGRHWLTPHISPASPM